MTESLSGASARRKVRSGSSSRFWSKYTIRNASARRISPPVGLDVSSQQAEQRGLAAAVRPHQSHSHSRRHGEIQALEQRAIADGVGNAIQRDQLLGLPVRRGKVNFGGGGAACGRSGPPVRRSSRELYRFAPLLWSGRALGPRRSHSISVCTRLARESCRFPCASKVLFFLLQKPAVVSFDAKKAIHIDAIELNDLAGDIFEKVAIVADHHAGERRILKKRFEPLESRRSPNGWSARRAAECRAPAPAPRQSPGVCASRPTRLRLGLQSP